MVSQFQSYIAKHFPFIQGKRLLIAVSGGLDSMMLFHLCKKQRMDIAIAHCNFGLRGEESEAETIFVKTTMEETQTPYYIKYFDTHAFAKEKKVSTQMAARELRYAWFQELVETNNFQYILTGHHANDAAETLLINLSRGAGVKGLSGIPRQNQNIIRPLLGFSRKQLKEYATNNCVQWKEDSSNASDNYLRNHIRHHAMTALEDASPHFLEGVTKSQEYVRQSVALLKVYEAQLKQELTFLTDDKQESVVFCIDINKLVLHPAPNAVLYTLLEDYGFTAWQDIYDLKDAQAGKKIHSSSHTILKDREILFLISNDIDKKSQEYLIKEDAYRVVIGEEQLQLEEVKERFSSGKNEIFVDKDTLKFPLYIRSWKEGDYFFPLGLGGKKKLSKFFKDEKLSLLQKEKVKILCSRDEIVWVLGMRPDNRFRVTEKTQTILKISYKAYEV